MRILVVEDEPLLRSQLAGALRSNDFVVDAAEDGVEGRYYGEEYGYDAAVIDLGLPKLSGIELIQILRRQERRFPILVLTARSRWQDKVEGLESGADDYLTKPFQLEELLARLNALIRRAAGHATPVLSNGPVRIDTSKKIAWLDDAQLDLTSFEYRVLEYLLLHHSRVVSKLELVEHLYEQDYDRDSNVIEVFVGRLRRKLRPHDVIKTIRGQGYRYIAEQSSEG
ncbi:MAG TPA: DNA-binding response regulator [Gammaproteobacteria bacterium]|nr:DNA-binding response regulator [Gammaproteobacteria bacterium]|tara:strand:+ start:5622 stop:6299 length:678 start_codon:yes stop_codon:yes gene_type:complete